MRAGLPLRPALESTRERLAFAVIMAFFLFLPWILMAWGKSEPSQFYDAVPTNTGPFGFFKRSIFEETGAVDVLVLGSSSSWTGIDARLVRDSLSQVLRREAVVLNFGSNWRGEDVYYALLRDLSSRRRIRLLIVNLPEPGVGRNEPHVKAHYWLRLGHDAESLSGLSWSRRLQIYSLHVLGAPRQLISILRADLRNPVVTETLGTYMVQQGYDEQTPFIPLAQQPPALSPEELVHSPATRDQFRVTGPPLGDYQAHWVRKILSLAQARGIPVAAICMPFYQSRRREVVELREWWPDLHGGRLRMIGIPNAVLFHGLSETRVRELFYDDYHLNENGMGFFTRAILPGILKIYLEEVDRT